MVTILTEAAFESFGKQSFNHQSSSSQSIINLFGALMFPPENTAVGISTAASRPASCSVWARQMMAIYIGQRSVLRNQFINPSVFVPVDRDLSYRHDRRPSFRTNLITSSISREAKSFLISSVSRRCGFNQGNAKLVQ